jgi:hypothetical protein
MHPKFFKGKKKSINEEELNGEKHFLTDAHVKRHQKNLPGALANAFGHMWHLKIFGISTCVAK